MPVNSLNTMNTYPNFMAAAMQQPLYINEFYDKSSIPDFFQKASRQATVGVDPHLSTFYHHTGNLLFMPFNIDKLYLKYSIVFENVKVQ